jgi:hypothetical protein
LNNFKLQQFELHVYHQDPPFRNNAGVIPVCLWNTGYIFQVPDATVNDKFNDGTIYEDFCVNDADLTFENYEELFGTSHIQIEQLFDDAGIDSYFEMKEMLPADSNSNEVCVFLFVCSFFFRVSSL